MKNGAPKIAVKTESGMTPADSDSAAKVVDQYA